MSGSEVSGVGLARQALLAAREAAKKNGATSKKPKRRHPYRRTARRARSARARQRDQPDDDRTRHGRHDFYLAKHRQGPTCVITTAFQGHYGRFVEMMHEAPTKK